MNMNIKSKQSLISILTGLIVGLPLMFIISPPFWGLILGILAAVYMGNVVGCLIGPSLMENVN